MPIPKLTREDLDTLMNATRAWAHEPLADGFVESIQRVMQMQRSGAGPKSEAEAEAMCKAENAEMEKAKEAAKGRSERSIMLQAKLIQIRDGIDVDDLLSC